MRGGSTVRQNREKKAPAGGRGKTMDEEGERGELYRRGNRFQEAAAREAQ